MQKYTHAHNNTVASVCILIELVYQSLYVFVPDCRAVCHTECKEKVPLPCVPAVHTPKKKLKVLIHHCAHMMFNVTSTIAVFSC